MPIQMQKGCCSRLRLICFELFVFFILNLYKVRPFWLCGLSSCMNSETFCVANSKCHEMENRPGKCQSPKIWNKEAKASQETQAVSKGLAHTPEIVIFEVTLILMLLVNFSPPLSSWHVSPARHKRQTCFFQPALCNRPMILIFMTCSFLKWLLPLL